MAEREITAVVKDKRGRVRTLFNPGAEWSPVSSVEAAAQIRAQAHRYIVSAGGPGHVVVRSYRRRWVRTIRDERGFNNLDELPSPVFADLVTGAFDVVITLAPDALDQVIREMHAAATIEDRHVLYRDGNLIEIRLGPPLVESTAGGDGTRCAVTREALCWVSRADTPADPGFSAVAVIRAEARLETVIHGDQGVVGLRLEFTAGAGDPVTIGTALSAERYAIVDAALREWVGTPDSGEWNTALPPELVDVKAIRTRLVEGERLQLGMAFEQQLPDHGLPSPGLSSGWSIAFSRQFLAARMGAAFEARFGAVPPPAGEGRVEVDAGSSIYIDYLELGLADGEVVLSGRAIRDVDPVVSANFRLTFVVGLTNAGLLTVSLDDVTVDVVEWYARLFDFLSGSALSRALRDGLREAISASGGDGVASFLSADLIGAIARAGTVRDVDIRPRVSWASVSPGGLVIGGNLRVPAQRRPRAVLTAVPGAVGAPVVLYGGGSSVPGGSVSEVRWDFGDGTSEVLTGTDRALVAGHRYAPGRHRVQLTIAGEDGGEGSDSLTVSVS